MAYIKHLCCLYIAFDVYNYILSRTKNVKKETSNWKFYCTEMFIHQEVEQLYLNNFILYIRNVGTSLTSLCYKIEIKIYILLGT